MADHQHCCSHAAASPSVQQTLDELDFERGVWSAALSGEVDKVKTYLQNAGDPNVVDSSGYTALHYAARNGHLHICDLLLGKRACVNVRTRSGGVTPLHRAAFCGHLDITKLLIDKGANVTLLDNDQKSALHKAAEGGHVDVARLLLKKDESLIHITDCRGKIAEEYVPQGNTALSALLSQT